MIDDREKTSSEERHARPAGPLALDINALTARLRAFFGSRVFTDDARDLVQETWARALASNISKAACPEAYMLGIARHVLVDLRRAQRRSYVPMEYALSELAMSAGVTPQGHGWIDDWLSTQPPLMRRLYEERVEFGKSQREAGSALGLSHRQIRTMETKLRSSILRLLRERDEDCAWCLGRKK